MSTLTPRLSLKRSDGIDPFLRQDFVDNLNKLDTAPGTHICTSVTRPTWDAAQAGRQILETDTKRVQYWTGTVWVDPIATPASWSFSLDPDFITPASYAPDSLTPFTLGSITLLRPTTLLATFVSQGRTLSSRTTSGYVAYTPLVNSLNARTDGSTVERAYGPGNMVFEPYASFPDTLPAQYLNRETTYFGTATLAAGVHTVGFSVRSRAVSGYFPGATRVTVVAVAPNGGA